VIPARPAGAASLHATTARPPRQIRRILISATIGTTIEWYDFYIYAATAALVFPHLFFPRNDPNIGMLEAFGTYTVGFAARPIGGMVFGHIGDRAGRKAALIASLLIMGVGTVLIGLLPTYQQLRAWAPGLLVAPVAADLDLPVLRPAWHGQTSRRGHRRRGVTGAVDHPIRATAGSDRRDLPDRGALQRCEHRLPTGLSAVGRECAAGGRGAAAGERLMIAGYLAALCVLTLLACRWLREPPAAYR
jgi:MFS family permease